MLCEGGPVQDRNLESFANYIDQTALNIIVITPGCLHSFTFTFSLQYNVQTIPNHLTDNRKMECKLF